LIRFDSVNNIVVLLNNIVVHVCLPYVRVWKIAALVNNIGSLLNNIVVHVRFPYVRVWKIAVLVKNIGAHARNIGVHAVLFAALLSWPGPPCGCFRFRLLLGSRIRRSHRQAQSHRRYLQCHGGNPGHRTDHDLSF